VPRGIGAVGDLATTIDHRAGHRRGRKTHWRPGPGRAIVSARIRVHVAVRIRIRIRIHVLAVDIIEPVIPRELAASSALRLAEAQARSLA
jgi:hypothetical protein